MDKITNDTVISPPQNKSQKMCTFFNSVLFRSRRTQRSRCIRLMIFVGAILTTGIPVLANDATTKTIKRPAAAPPNVTSEMMAEYRQKFAKYKFARQEFDNEAATYWKSISDKRRVRSAKRRNNEKILLDDYVLTQPPVYRGPPRPVDPSAGALEEPVAPPKYVPIIADFLKNAAEQFQFEPQNPASEIEFKRAYAKVASAAGLTKEQVVRIYGFEAGGNGKYDVQAGLEYNGPNAHAVSTALGYNQLLATSSVELLAEQGSQFVQTLKKKADGLTESQRIALEKKIAILQRMIDFSKTVPDDWSEHERLANTPKGLGIHALNLDIDLGPLLQVQKLLNSINFARQQGYSEKLSATELEMMNLTGDGNGFDIVTMPNSMRTRVPTSNFFQQGGYERNPVASKNNVVSELLAVTDSEMDGESALQGAKDLAAAF
jgi:hypothetical protein